LSFYVCNQRIYATLDGNSTYSIEDMDNLRPPWLRVYHRIQSVSSPYINFSLFIHYNTKKRVPLLSIYDVRYSCGVRKVNRGLGRAFVVHKNRDLEGNPVN
jgi:hypothetical protein